MSEGHGGGLAGHSGFDDRLGIDARPAGGAVEQLSVFNESVPVVQKGAGEDFRIPRGEPGAEEVARSLRIAEDVGPFEAIVASFVAADPAPLAENNPLISA